jgi:heme A synthase
MKLNRFAAYVWGVLIYHVLVIIWGGFVRATGSGAGCGGHWPTCNGQVIPHAPQLETIIEFTHRLSSGLAGILVIGLVIWAFRAYAKGHIVRLGAAFSLVFIITEGLIGAALVLFDWVAYNPSLSRAFAVSAHLVNTFILLAFLALTAWWASGGKPVHLRGQGRQRWLLGLGLLAVMGLGASGAVTALGDTLFPVASLAEGVRQDLSPAEHFLIRLRVIHPLLALLTGLYIALLGSIFRAPHYDRTTRRLAKGLIALFLLQLGVGTLNLLLLVPVWTQLVHLLMTDLVWIVLVLLSASVLTEDQVAVDGVEEARPYVARST